MRNVSFLAMFSLSFFILGICSAKTIGIGASPMKVEVGLGNETNATNDISYDFVIYNTGETRLRIVPSYIDENLKNFSRPLIDELIIEPNTNERFPILFFRNGTGEKRLNMTLRFIGEPNETIEQGMIAIKPATDIRITLIQKPINSSSKKSFSDFIMKYIIYLIIIIFVIILFLIWLFFYPKKQ